MYCTIAVTSVEPRGRLDDGSCRNHSPVPVDVAGAGWNGSPLKHQSVHRLNEGLSVNNKKPIQEDPRRESRTPTASRRRNPKSNEDGKKASLFDRPLRLPGQSVDEQLDDLHDKMAEKALLSLFMVVLARRSWLASARRKSTAITEARPALARCSWQDGYSSDRIG